MGKFVIKSIANAQPDVVVMEEAREYNSTDLHGIKSSVDKTISTIVNVKRVFKGENSNSTLYRITKKRRKKTTTSPKKPKSLPKLSSSTVSGSKNALGTVSSGNNEKKTSGITKNRGHHTAIKRIKKKRLKSGRKVNAKRREDIKSLVIPSSLKTKRVETTQSTPESINNRKE